MSYNTNTAYAWLSLMGKTFQAEIEYEVTNPGGKAIIDYNHGGDPGWPPEWDIETIILREDRDDDLGPPFEATGKLFNMLTNRSRNVIEAVSDHITFGE